MRNLIGLSSASIELAKSLLDEYDIGHGSRFMDGPPEFRYVEELDLALFLSKCDSFVRTWPRPIPVSERLPEPRTTVLVWPGYLQNPGYQLGAYWPDDDEVSPWRSTDGDYLQSTHWLPLPPKPDASATQCSPPEQFE